MRDAKTKTLTLDTQSVTVATGAVVLLLVVLITTLSGAAAPV